MKVSEFKKNTLIDEGISNALLGDYGAAKLKGMFSGKSTTQQMTQDIFLRDFYSDAISALQNGIASGLVNPKISNKTTTTATEIDPALATPIYNQTNDTSSTTNSRIPSTTAINHSQKQTIKDINNYIKIAAKTLNATEDKNEKIVLTKKLINAMANRKGTAEWNNALGTVQHIIKTGGFNSNFTGSAIQALKAGKTITESWKIYYLNKLIETSGLTWKELGLVVLRENKNFYIAESKFIKLNYVFENIVESEEGESISQYLSGWFSQYMQGVDWTSRKQAIDKLIQQVEDTYNRDKGKTAIKQLAKMAFAVSKGNAPGETKNNTINTSPSDQPTHPDTEQLPPSEKATINATKVQTDLTTLKKSDPKGYEAIVNQIITDYKKAYSSSTSSASSSKDAAGRIPPDDIAEAKHKI